MEYFGLMIEKVWSLFNLNITIWGFQFSFANIFMFSILVSLVGLFIKGLFGGD